jgi:hypothetical protein
MMLADVSTGISDILAAYKPKLALPVAVLGRLHG